MSTEEEIKQYIESQPEPKRADLQILHQLIMKLSATGKLWFLNGRDDKGKIVSNPSVGYGSYVINYADGTSKEFYKVGLSANTSGISVYILGLKDKEYLRQTYGNTIGKASVTGYCIKFKKLIDINTAVLESAIQFGFKH